MRSRCTDLTAWGETQSLSEWARDERCSVTAQTLGRRLRVHRSWSPERIIETPDTHLTCLRGTDRGGRRIKAWGESKTVIGWLKDKRCCVGSSLIYGRLKKHPKWSGEQILGTPCEHRAGEGDA